MKKKKRKKRKNSPFITTIIHVIRDRVPPAGYLRTRVLVRRTPGRLRGFLFCVVDVVAWIGGGAALALERVHETEPMPDLMHGRAAEIVPGYHAARQAACVDVAAVVDVPVRRRRGKGRRRKWPGGGAGRGVALRRGERAVTKQQRACVGRRRPWRAQVGLEVEVEGRVGPVAERRFHRFGVRVGGPVIVNRVGWLEPAERDVGRSVGSAQNGSLAEEGWSKVLGQNTERTIWGK